MIAGYSLFDTAIGRCGIAWGLHGVRHLQLPEATDFETIGRLRKRDLTLVEAAPPAQVRRVILDIQSLLAGQKKDLRGARLDMSDVPTFYQKVYAAARGIDPGTTLTYGDVAKKIGKPGSSRAVGQALGRNPFAIIVPCHRVLAANGKMGGFSANGGTVTKHKMLEIEGALPKSLLTNQESNAWSFDPEVALAHLRVSDPQLGKLIDRVGPFRMELKSTQSLFVALAEAIVHQQLTGKAAATIFGRVCGLFPGGMRGLSAKGMDSVSDEALRIAGLSGAKTKALRDLAEKANAGTIPTLTDVTRMEDEAIIQRLVQVRGIGCWTVEMLLMFRLGRPNILPVDDYGIKKGFSFAFRKKDLPSAADMQRRAARWAPYRTVASWYLWRAAEFAKKNSKQVR